MQNDDKPPLWKRWAQLRFAIVGQLLASPPEPGELRPALERLAELTWIHPGTAKPTRFGFSTLERWYYTARANAADPVGVLRRKTRSDSGQTKAVTLAQREFLRAQHRDHQSWTYQLHFDNLVAAAESEPALAELPSYASTRRFMKHTNLNRKRRARAHPRPGELIAAQSLEEREVLSFESPYVNGLWHVDFHGCSLPVLHPTGEWVYPEVMGMLDDRSRVACHVQWYWRENTEAAVHGLMQALQKWRRPRSLLSDNGKAFLAAETEQGLERLGVTHDTTLFYRPDQNGKQEKFWAQLEGRVVAMLENCQDRTLELLNRATDAWVTQEYNRKFHREIGMSPLQRYLQGPDLGRDCPSSDDLRLAFAYQQRRTQRRTDGTISIASRRFQIPAHTRRIVANELPRIKAELLKERIKKLRAHAIQPANLIRREF